MQEFLSEYGLYIVSVIIIAERIARLTPDKSDNRIVALVRKIAKALGLKFKDRK